jgi:four helix bundle protein
VKLGSPNANNMQDLKARTKRFALDVIRFCRSLPQTDEFIIVRRQVLRSATSIAANYRAALRAKSKADFVHKLGTVEEEADETLFWLEVLSELSPPTNPELTRPLRESDELVAIAVASRKTARR